jgi:hypothetical protein
MYAQVKRTERVQVVVLGGACWQTSGRFGLQRCPAGTAGDMLATRDSVPDPTPCTQIFTLELHWDRLTAQGAKQQRILG